MPRGAPRLVPLAPEQFRVAPAPAVLAAAAAAMPPGLCGEHADAIAAVAATGALTSNLFSDIVRRGAAAAGLPVTPCRCCQRVPPETAEQLEHFRRIYDADAYVGTRAFAHAAARAVRDLTRDELVAVRAALIANGAGSADADAVNAARPGLAIVAPPCRLAAVWAYSTPEARRLARWLARRIPGFTLRVASSDCSVYPSEPYRLYEFVGATAALVRQWVEKMAAAAPVPAPAPEPARGGRAVPRAAKLKRRHLP